MDCLNHAMGRRLLPALFTLASLAGSAAAADLAAPPPAPKQVESADPDTWTFSVMPYLWAAGNSGQTAQFGLPRVDFDLPFRDVLDHLDFAAMAMAEARHGDFSLFGDLVYLDLSHETATPQGMLALTAELSFAATAGTVGAGYSLLRDGESHLDIAVAARIWHFDTGLAFYGGLLNGLSPNDGATWVDGLVGLRGTYAINSSFYLTGWALAGAGGAQLDWDVAAAVGYRFNRSLSILAGYRAVGINYDRGGFVFDAVQQGPLVGLKLEF